MLHPDSTPEPVTGAHPEPAGVAVPDFERLYLDQSDPWQVRSSFYEQRKLDIVMAVLGQPFYRAAWDPACGVGELAHRLTTRCTHVLATDLAASAVALTRERCADDDRVSVSRLMLPAPPETEHRFDLIVLSEFLYYLDADDRASTLSLVEATVCDEAEVVSVHWRHHPHDAWLSGADTEIEIADHLLGHGWSRAVRHDDDDFVLQRFTKTTS